MNRTNNLDLIKEPKNYVTFHSLNTWNDKEISYISDSKTKTTSFEEWSDEEILQINL